MNLTSNVGPAGYQQTAIGPSGEVQAVNADGSAASIAYVPAAPAAWNPAPSTVAGALDQLTTERTRFIFRPGDPAPSGNVFATWAALYAALLATPGGAKTICFDSALASCTIPAGAYDFGFGCCFFGILPGDAATANRIDVICSAGVTFTTPIETIDNVRLSYNGTGALMTVPATGKIFHLYMRNFSRCSMNAAGGRIYDIPAGAVLLAELWDAAVINAPVAGAFFANITGNTAATNFSLDVNSVAQINGVIPANCLQGVAGATYAFSASRLNLFTTGTATAPSSQQNAMPGGIVTPLMTMSAVNSSYTPAVPAQWVAPAPISIKAALDRIAAVVSVGGATPIP